MLDILQHSVEYRIKTALVDVNPDACFLLEPNKWATWPSKAAGSPRADLGYPSLSGQRRILSTHFSFFTMSFYSTHKQLVAMPLDAMMRRASAEVFAWMVISPRIADQSHTSYTAARPPTS